ncbi:hypothetical protein F5876DRAFT_50294, partial [Lentinula aff. lateritia]
GKIPNYFDDVQDFEKFDEEEEPDTGYYAGPVQQYQEEDEIEAVLSHSRDEGCEADPEDVWFDNIQFHIKWKNFSHLHNTDKTYELLKRFKGLKHVDNYVKAYRLWQSYVNAPNLLQEDKEALLLDKEREKEDLETFKTVERIITHREPEDQDGNPTVDYFCKWTGLDYERCTWETQKDVNPIIKDQIEAYRLREAEGRFPYKSPVYPKNSRPAFHKITEDRRDRLQAEGLPANWS